jgi:hypothetical protein
MGIEHVPPEVMNLLAIQPVRNPRVEWEEDPETGLVTVIFPKQFTRTERALKRVVKGVDEIRRPLDEVGSDIWRMCDGTHDIATICTAIDDKYKEAMEPVLKRVVGFIEQLAQRGLVLLRREQVEAQEETA